MKGKQEMKRIGKMIIVALLIGGSSACLTFLKAGDGHKYGAVEFIVTCKCSRCGQLFSFESGHIIPNKCPSCGGVLYRQ